MAHPMRQSAKDGHAAKIKAMTERYGSASGDADNLLAPADKLKAMGPEDSVGFGAESEAPRARADRGSRSRPKAMPVATLATGGAVHRARGGRTKHKGKGTNVNVIVAPHGGPGPGAGAMPMAGMPPGGPPPGMPPHPPMGGPPMGGPPLGGPGGPPPMGGPPGGMPPGMIPPGLAPRAKGGRVHSDEAEDRAMVKGMVKPSALRAAGGRVHHFDAGAASGEGRLEKIGKHPKAPAKPQAV